MPRDFGCVHDTGFVHNYQPGAYYGPDPNFKVYQNTMRLFGMGMLEWNNTETSPGVYNWTKWDEAVGKARSAGVTNFVYNFYNLPQFYARYGHEYGKWQMQLPNNREATERWLSAITSRYPEIKTIEIANEVFTPGIGDGFHIGSAPLQNSPSFRIGCSTGARRPAGAARCGRPAFLGSAAT